MIMKESSSQWSTFGPAPWLPTVANHMKPFYYWLKDFNLREYMFNGYKIVPHISKRIIAL